MFIWIFVLPSASPRMLLISPKSAYYSRAPDDFWNAKSSHTYISSNATVTYFARSGDSCSSANLTATYLWNMKIQTLMENDADSHSMSTQMEE